MSVKKNFLNKSSIDELDAQDNLIEITKSYNPGPTAMRLHRSQAKIRLARGGLGSGKTRCACEHIDELARTYPGSMHLIARKDLTSLRDTTQKVFLEEVVIPETIADFNVHENTLVYKNGSKVIFKETKDPDKVLSLEITSFLIDEATENDTRALIDKLRYRLRQKVWIDGVLTYPPFAGILVFNPPSKEHWLYALSQEHDVEDIQFSTYENSHNLPPDYIENYERNNPPHERKRLLDGEWGIEVKGDPVIHGFTEKDNVRSLIVRPDLPLIRGWDFGWGHPCAVISQYDPTVGKRGRVLMLGEMLGKHEKLNTFAPKVKELTKSISGHSGQVIDYGDPHGADEKDVGESSVEYLRIHHGIHVNYKRQRIKVGIEEIQELVTSRAPLQKDSQETESCFLVDRRCPIAIETYTFGYHKDPNGVPVKDGYYDHIADAVRYLVVGVRGRSTVSKMKKKKWIPKNRYTGY